MQPSHVIQHIVPGALWVVGPSFLGFVAAILVGVLLSQRKAVPGGVGALVVVVPALVSLVVGAWLVGSAQGAPFTEALPAMAAGLGARFTMLVCAPGIAAGLGMFAAFAGARGDDRSLPSAVLVGLLALCTALTPLVYAVQNSDWAHPIVRALLYTMLGVLTATAALGSEAEEGAGPEAASMAGVSFAWTVACVEAALLAMAYVVMVKNAPGVVSTEAYVSWSAGMVIHSLQQWSLATVAAAAVAGSAAQIPSLRSGRVAGGLLGVGMCVAALAPVWFGFPSEALLFELLSGR